MKQWTIGQRIIGGFAAITTIAAALGVTGYLMFSRVDREVSALSKHSLPAVQNSTGVERSAFECIAEEKNYVIEAKDETHQKAKAKVAELMANLDKVEKVAADFKDAKLAQKSQEVRKISAQWAELYDKGVAAIKNTKTNANTLSEKGRVVGAEADAYMAAKKSEYLESKNALAIVNQIDALALETRMNEKAYMLFKEAQYFNNITTNITALLGAYDSLEKLHPDAAEQKQITEARQATKDYYAAAQKWVEIQKATVAGEAVMDKTYAVVMKEYTGFMADKEKDFHTATNEVSRTNDFQMLMTGATVADYANAAVIFSKKYMLYGKAEDWKAVTDNIDLLLKSFTDLRKIATDDADRQAIDAADKATQEYLAAANAWVANDKLMKAAATTMDAGGATVGNTANAYAAAKTGRTDKVADAVFIVSQISQEALNTRLSSRRYMMSQDPKDWTLLTNGIVALDKYYDDLRKVSLTADDQQRIDRAEKATQEYLVAANAWVDNDNELRKAILPQMTAIGETVLTTAQTAENDAWKDSNTASATVAGIVLTSKTIITFALLAGLLVAAVCSVFITRTITRAIKLVAENISNGSTQAASASGQVSAASQSLAEGASEQAASLEETSSSLEEMASMTRQNAQSAQQTKDLAGQTREAAEKGATSTEEMNRLIQAIKVSSEQMKGAMDAVKLSNDEVSKIIKTIDEIAFQTNILALNAAVEAARAGEAGMGFAVVADEVRSLAQKSALSARETTEKIEASIKRTEQGVQVSLRVNDDLQQVVAKAGEVQTNLQSIVDRVRQVDTLVAEIATASNEQSQGIEQVNKAVAEMDKVTQSNAANAEESASAAEELNAQADSLMDAVHDLMLLVDNKHSTPSATHAAIKVKHPVVKKVQEHADHAESATFSMASRKNGNGNGQVRVAALNGRKPELVEESFKDF